MPEPEKGLELNIALIKQMTGGGRLTVRAMYDGRYCNVVHGVAIL
ncbi:hypothetical protein FACS1894105_00580 [Clostridia bacterium]|nr:hypothetical protein FACS1894105_00580 [Clostridia bacterium]